MLLQGHQLAGMVDDVDVRGTRIDVGGGGIRWWAKAVEEQASRLVLRMPLRCANPAVTITGAASIFVRFEEEGVDHAVAAKWKVRALRVELGIRSVAVISAGQRVRDAPQDRQIEIVLAAHRFEQTGKLGWNGLGLGHGILLVVLRLNLNSNWCGHL